MVRDVARVMGISLRESDRIAKLIPFRLDMTIDQALVENPRLRAEYESSAEMKNWLRCV